MSRSVSKDPQLLGRGETRAQLQGYLESVECVAVGWLHNDANPDSPVTFELLVNNRPVGSFLADRKRQDVQKKKRIGSGHCGFRVPIPQQRLVEGENVISIVVDSKPVGLPVSFFYNKGGASGVLRLVPLASPRPARASKRKRAEVAANAHQVSTAPVHVLSPAPAKPQVAYSVSKRSAAVQANFASALNAQAQKFISSVLALTTLDEKHQFALVDGAFRERNWDLVELTCAALAARGPLSDRILALYGRALLHLNRPDEAVPILSHAAELNSNKASNIFYLGLAYSRLDRWRQAADIFDKCISLTDAHARYFHEAGRAYVQLGFGGYGLYEEDRSVLQKAREYLERAVELDTNDWRTCRDLSALLLALGKFDDAYNIALMGSQRGASEAAAFTELARICIRINKPREGLAAARRALELDPAGDVPKFNLRLATRLLESCADEVDGTVALVMTGDDVRRPAELPPSISAVRIEKGGDLLERLKHIDARWVVFPASAAIEVKEIRNIVDHFGFGWSAGVRQRPDSDPIIWRRDFLVSLMEARVVPPTTDAPGLTQAAMHCGAFSTVNSFMLDDLRAQLPRGRTVLLFSQYGIKKFGGGEHFLQQMAQLYCKMGFDVLVVGTQPEYVGERGTSNGLRYIFIDRTPEDVLRLAVGERAVLAHVISGLIFEVLTALRYLDIKIVHGIHFWRDMLVNPTPSTGYYPNIDIGAEPRVEFRTVVQQADVIYSNSEYTQMQVEKYFGVRTPVIFSLPDDVESSSSGSLRPSDRDFVLLTNTRADKGFNFVLDVAKALPNIRFLALASQTSMESAIAAVQECGLKNVEIRGYVENMEELYAKARAVAVPSYRFVETFSRVVIEAHRFGTPVIGSNRGNVPHLLAETGISLPEDVAVWADEVEQLFASDHYWSSRSELALENSQRYAFSMQEERLSGLISSLAAPVLVGVGSGLGNVIHTTPLIRHLARRLGRRIDVVIMGDHEDMLFIMANKQYVNHMFTLKDDVLRRHYELVFLTHSFGNITPRFACSRVISSRTWDNFTPEHALHEAEFNLAASQALLGVPYDLEDSFGYFIGEFTYVPPAEKLVGLHAGSKTGRWATKRWPHYEDFARRLRRRGVNVASFGTADEYVPGTVDMTGGTLEEMTKKMLACSHFVANDSGVMNIANALGIPLLALFAPTNPHTRGPLKPTSRSLSVERACAPCEIHSEFKVNMFSTGKCRCIADIDLDVVLDTLTHMMQSEGS